MTVIHADANRKANDERSSLETLARETDTAFNLVQAIYQEELEALAAQAKVTTYVRLLAMRRTRLVVQALDGKHVPEDIH